MRTRRNIYAEVPLSRTGLGHASTLIARTSQAWPSAVADRVPPNRVNLEIDLTGLRTGILPPSMATRVDADAVRYDHSHAVVEHAAAVHARFDEARVGRPALGAAR